jgi:hypothetical protein
MRAFDAAWNLLKAIPRDQVYTERTAPYGYGQVPAVEQQRLGTMHPAIRGLLERQIQTGMASRIDDGRVGDFIEEIPQGMDEDMGEQARGGTPIFFDEPQLMLTRHLERYMMKPYDPSLTGSYDGNMFRNVIPDDPNAEPRLSY